MSSTSPVAPAPSPTSQDTSKPPSTESTPTTTESTSATPFVMPKLDLEDSPAHAAYDAQLPCTPSGPFHLRGKVVHGFARGSKLLGCPTANLDPAAFEHILVNVPRGVYAGWVQINHGPVYKTLLSLGLNPTFNTQKETVEAYILHDFPCDFYGATMSLIICAYLRPSENFGGLDALMQAISRDVRVGRKYLETNEQSAVFAKDPFFYPVDPEDEAKLIRYCEQTAADSTEQDTSSTDSTAAATTQSTENSNSSSTDQPSTTSNP